MKKVIYFIFAMTIIVGASCSKNSGPEGPAGTRGERGEKGETGAKGIAGTDGNLLLYGNAAPASTLGKAGDFYIDKKNGDLYGPKATSGWGTAVDMRGATGATGAKGAMGDKGATGSKGDKGATGDRGATGATGDAGSQFLSGTVAPAATVGKPGDFYFNTATGQLFGPKNLSNTWAGGIGLKGSKGDKGDTGAKGETGAQGVRGTDGNLILSGTGVPASTLGKVGDYYIDKANSKLYGPKSAGWGTAADMRGATGDMGATGAAGSQIFSGVGAPAAGTGMPGDFYLNTTTAELFGPKNTDNTWAAGSISLKGEKGEKGDTGNANVKVYTKNISSEMWTAVGSSPLAYLRLIIAAPNVLTQDVVDNWTILVYIKGTDFQPGWALLPYFTSRGVRLNYNVRKGEVEIQRDQNGGAGTQSSFSSVKLVLIEPSSTGIISYDNNLREEALRQAGYVVAGEIR